MSSPVAPTCRRHPSTCGMSVSRTIGCSDGRRHSSCHVLSTHQRRADRSDNCWRHAFVSQIRDPRTTSKDLLGYTTKKSQRLLISSYPLRQSGIAVDRQIYFDQDCREAKRQTRCLERAARQADLNDTAAVAAACLCVDRPATRLPRSPSYKERRVLVG